MSNTMAKVSIAVPMQKLITFFNNELTHGVTKKNKIIGIGVAATMTLIYFVQDWALRPPKNLRHIPYLGYFSVIKSLYTNDSFFKRAHKVNLPFLNNDNNLGVYLEPGMLGWEVNISDPEDAKLVLMKHEIFPKIDIREANVGNFFAKFLGGPSVLNLSSNQWKTQRMIINPAFRRSSPITLFGEVAKEMFVCMETMDETVNVSDLLLRYTLDAIGRAAFDYNFNTLSNESDNEWLETYKHIIIGLRDIKFFVFPSLDKHLLWLFPQRRRIHKKLDRLKEMLDEVIEYKRTLLKEGIVYNSHLEENEKDVLTLLIESQSTGKEMITDEELKSNLRLFFFAGQSTSASVLSFALHELSKHPEVQQKAREEAITILGDEPMDVIPTMEDTKKMVYINQVLKETLRLHCPAPRVLTRTVAEDTILPSGTFVPEGSHLTVNIYNLHHRNKHWKDSNEFNPDRFASNGDGIRGSGEGVAWSPFGNGARQCIGMNFTLNEQRVLLSMMLKKFTWSAPKHAENSEQMPTAGFPIVSPVDLEITFHKRY